MKLVGIVLLVAGIAGLAMGTLEYTQTKDVLKVGPLDVKAKEEKTLAIPPAAAAAVAAVGLVLVIAGRKK